MIVLYLQVPAVEDYVYLLVASSSYRYPVEKI